jgi:type II secretory ATPase GspE/PulE/Tfp pilus assembly ATPase PilB-like protein
MRILDPAAMRVELDVLGMPDDVKTKWQRAIHVPYGLVIVTGPTGSGKTSTLYASLNQMDHKTKNIVTVEDPIEYEFENNIAQVQVSERMTFPRVMRSFLRQDPDIMLVGEMRDAESLAIGIQAGLTGHLVLTTLHTNNAVETIGRMVDMDAEPYLIAGTCVAIMGQRLVRLICPKCKEPFQAPQAEIEMLKFTPEELQRAKIMHGKGCADCRGTGYKGRVGVFELILGTPELKQAIANGGDYKELNAAARSQGYRTMLEDGKDKVMNGVTTPDEVLRAVYTQALE